MARVNNFRSSILLHIWNDNHRGRAVMKKQYKGQFTVWSKKKLVTGGESSPLKQSHEEKQAQAVANQSILKAMEK